MKTLEVDKLTVDLTPAIPYLDALETAENFANLFVWCQRYEESYYMVDPRNYVGPPMEELLEEAMETINTHCPWLWPAIDRQILAIVESR